MTLSANLKYRVILQIALCLFTANAFADPATEEKTLKVSLAGSDSLSASPGQIVTTAFVISNSSAGVRNVSTWADLPDGWQLVSQAVSTSEIQEGASKTILVSIKIDPDAEVNSYPVVFSIADSENPDENDSSTLLVHVQQRDEIAITVLNSPQFVVAGDDMVVDIMMINSGNASVSLTTSVTTVPFAKSKIEPESAIVAPGTEQLVTITVRSSSSLTSRRRQLVQIQAIPDHQPAAHVESIVWADILPGGRAASNGSRIPAYFKATGLQSDRGRGGQFEFGARGTLVEGSSKSIDLLVRTPDLASTSLYGRRDEYRIEYSTENISVKLGDHPFALSPLTEYGRLGRGAGVAFGTGKISAGGFVSRNRVIFPRENQVGGTVNFQLHERADFSANYINKTGIDPGQSISIRSRLNPLESTTLDIELGDGVSGGVHSSGYSFAAGVNLDWMNLSARHISAGPQFPGYYSDFETTSSSIIVKPSNQLRLEGMVQHHGRGFQNSLTVGESLRSKTLFYQVGPVAETKIAGLPVQLAANYQFRETVTSGSLTEIDQTETVLSMRAGIRLWRFDIGSKVERGEVRSTTLGSTLPARRYEISTGFNMGRFSYSMAAERLNGASLYRLQDRSITILKLNASAKVTGRTRLDVDAFSIHDPIYSSGRYSFVQSSLNHRFNFGHILSVNGGFTSVDSGLRHAQSDIGVSYEVPIGVPRFGKKNGRLFGRVVNSQTGKGVGGVRLTLGDQVAVTNSNGEYSFLRTRPGTKFVIIDQSTIEINQTSMSANPFQFEELADVSDLPVIYLVNSSSVNGSVLFEDGKPVVGAVVEIQDEYGKSRMVTEDDGQFRFNKIRPGDWRVRVVYARIPSSFKPEQDEYRITLESGKQGTVVIQMVEEKRKIKFVATGAIGKVSAPDLGNSVADSTVADSTAAADLDPAETDSTSDGLEASVDEPDDGECIPLQNVGAIRHTVLSGETLLSLAVQYYCDPVMWPHIWLTNRTALSYEGALEKNPDLLIPDLRIPDMTQPMDAKSHHVGSGETLSELSRGFYGDYMMWPRIWISNQETISDPDRIFPGMLLRIPASTELEELEVEFIEVPLVLDN